MNRIISGSFVSAAFIFVMSLAAFPVMSQPVSAAEDSAKLTMDVEVQPVIAIYLGKESVTLDITPTSAGVAAADGTTANVSTNNLTGYTLNMSILGDDTSLTQTGTTDKISSTTSTVTAANLTSNTWGYSLDSGASATYSAVPLAAQAVTLGTSDAPVTLDSTSVSFAAKADTSIASGVYSGSVLFSAVTNYVSPTFGGITTMQEMTAAICDAETTPSKDATETTNIHRNSTDLVPEATLTDTRDGEQYTVRKLADGNCWMTQNLRLQLSTSKPLTPADSNVATNWTPTYNTQTATGTTWGNASANEARSYVDTANKENGGYYTWYAATAGQGSYSMSTRGENTTASICPKGWQLPEGYTSMNKSFGNLTTAYYGTNSTTVHNNTIFQAPLSIVLSDAYNFNDGSVDSVGAYLWSSTVGSASNAYFMVVDRSNVNPQYSFGKATGRSIRCVARGPQYTINFNSSEADSGIASASADLGGNIDLAYYSSLFQKSGYTLKQWKDQDNNTYDATSTSVNVNPSNSNTITLTAVWQKNGPENPTNSPLMTALENAGAAYAKASDGKDYYTMQSMTSSICSAVQTPDKSETNVPEATLIDTRDNELYTVRKLADGNCWMTQNLRLKLTANQALTSADTDVSSNFTPTISTQPTSENTTSWGSYNTASDVNKSRSYDTGNRDYGTYYNWYTATAGTGFYDNTTTNATSSICPKGWQLPLNTGTKSYSNLITTTYGLASNAEGFTALQSAPLSFPLSGDYGYSGSVLDQGSYGLFWSATPHSSAYYAYRLAFGSSYIIPQSNKDKANGFSVCCVVR